MIRYAVVAYADGVEHALDDGVKALTGLPAYEKPARFYNVWERVGLYHPKPVEISIPYTPR